MQLTSYFLIFKLSFNPSGLLEVNGILMFINWIRTVNCAYKSIPDVLCFWTSPDVLELLFFLETRLINSFYLGLIYELQFHVNLNFPLSVKD